MDGRQLSRQDMDLMMDVNRLTFRKPLDSSLVDIRQLRRYQFSPNNYLTGESTQAEIVIGSGGDYINGPGSYLQLTVSAVTAAGTAATVGNSKFATDFEEGKSPAVQGSSAFNLFRTHEITHRSGDLIDRTTNLNSLVQSRLIYENNESYLKNYAGVFGAQNADGSYDDLKTAKTYMLPLSLFSGLFAQEALIPANLIAGSRMRLEFAPFSEAMGGQVWAGAAPAADEASQFRITNMALLLDSYKLYDNAVGELRDAQVNEKTQGLQYPFWSYFNISKTITTDLLSFDLNFAAGKVMQLIVKSRNRANAANTQAGVASDFMGGEDYDYTNIRARLGSTTFPQHLIDSAAQAYVITQESWDANAVNDLVELKRGDASGSYENYTTPGSGAPIVAWNMERSNVLRLSGELTNNSRLLNVEATYGSSVPAPGRQVDAWIRHMRVANVMLDNITLDR